MDKKVDAKEFKTVRAVIDYINENNISREDIVDLIDREHQLFLIYYLS